MTCIENLKPGLHPGCFFLQKGAWLFADSLEKVGIQDLNICFENAIDHFDGYLFFFLYSFFLEKKATLCYLFQKNVQLFLE